jgi:hypothetical protein
MIQPKLLIEEPIKPSKLEESVSVLNVSLDKSSSMHSPISIKKKLNLKSLEANATYGMSIVYRSRTPSNNQQFSTG